MIVLPFIILASCIFMDLAWNNGNGISNIVSSFRSPRVSPEENKYALIREMVEEMDKLYDDKEYEKEGSQEIETIEQKIKIRAQILEKIL